MTSRFSRARRVQALGLLTSRMPATRWPWAALIVQSLTLATGCEHPKATPRDTPASAAITLMTPQDLQALPSQASDQRAAYGADSSQYGELRVPSGVGPHPVAVLVHGGCFKAAYATARDLAPMGDALKADGIATWNIEYRRLGQPGGGWPGTYLDVGRAVDHLRAIGGKHNLDLGRVVLVGHSAGGHLAMWAAGRARVPATSSVYMRDPLPVRGDHHLAGRLPRRSARALCRGLADQAAAAGNPPGARHRRARGLRAAPARRGLCAHRRARRRPREAHRYSGCRPLRDRQSTFAGMAGGRGGHPIAGGWSLTGAVGGTRAAGQSARLRAPRPDPRMQPTNAARPELT